MIIEKIYVTFQRWTSGHVTSTCPAVAPSNIRGPGWRGSDGGGPLLQQTARPQHSDALAARLAQAGAGSRLAAQEAVSREAGGETARRTLGAWSYGAYLAISRVMMGEQIYDS